jgi:ribosomal protein S18 acetylase RimI-like enzyme
MKLTLRTYQSEEDYWSMREFLRRVMILNNRRELSWHVARLDYWWWFVNPHFEKKLPQETLFLWETEDHEIAAVIATDGPAVFPQAHPAFRTAELDEEMIATAERYLGETGQAGRRVEIDIDSEDKQYQEILSRHGFQRVERPGEAEVQHRRSLEGALPKVPAISGYTIRPMGAGLELLERCYASGLGFHDDDIHYARKNRDDPSWYLGIQSAPLYRRDLDIVAVACDGSIAAFCTAWFDDVSRTGFLEPVATVPAHRKRGLGKAVILEALHRLQQMGCKVAFVGGFSERANALYFSVMGPECNILEPWEKISQA